MDAREVLDQLRAMGSTRDREGMSRFGINVDNALGVSVTALRKLGRRLPRDHRLAGELWDLGIHEARILASIVDTPELVSRTQMERWVRAFNSWDLCDQVCMNLFWATPFAHEKIVAWSGRRGEFVKRASFAMIASAAVKDRKAPPQRFLDYLPIIDREAGDGRNFVRKAVSWALRQIGKRDAELHARAIELARKLGETAETRWVGRDALRELDGAKVRESLGLG